MNTTASQDEHTTNPLADGYQNDRLAGETAKQIVTLERVALDRWCKGDPSGYLEISAEDIVYFDPFQDRRIDGRQTLAKYYEALRGKVSADRYELLNPLVQAIGDAAVLTFNFISYGGNENKLYWNCTEVYRREGTAWQIIQSHWSFTKPPTPSA
jgi:ketosteroid isomerase-like protein